MKMNTENVAPVPDRATWKSIVARYSAPAVTKSTWQLVNTLVPYLALVALMIWSLRGPYWVTLLLAIPGAGLAVRLFIIAHDCGHRSFFKSRRANDFWGTIAAGFVLTPYVYWRNEHARHHLSAGNLDRRGIGDVWTLTVSEYEQKPAGVRFLYRLYRNPIMLFVIVPILLFLVGYRFWDKWAGKMERLSILRTNLAFAAVLAIAHYTIGLKALFLVQFPVLALAASAGVWLFYVQHQFENVYWSKDADWDFYRMAIEGSSFYRLPKVLQWFSGNIGYHHIHHLSPRIPNYKLERCHHENPLFHAARMLTPRDSLRTLRFRLWDEARRQMVGWQPSGA
jgi:omega-6 fatty acid desaturase (delta-12 desaturase)